MWWKVAEVAFWWCSLKKLFLNSWSFLRKKHLRRKTIKAKLHLQRSTPTSAPNPSAFSPSLTALPPLPTPSTQANNESGAKVEEASLLSLKIFEDLHKKCQGIHSEYMTGKLQFFFLFFFWLFISLGLRLLQFLRAWYARCAICLWRCHGFIPVKK